MTADDVVARLDGVRRNGDGWTARCPAHDDRHASLSVGVGHDGRVLLKCHAGDGCPVDAIVAAIGLQLGDLFETTNGASQIVATYDYVDEDGALLFQAVRKAPKTFLQRRPDGRGGWIYKLGSTRRVLYRLPRVLEAVATGETVYVVEGEKDVHALEQAGVVATCNPMGAGKWRPQYAKTLRVANVVVVQDRDDAGREHAAKVVASLVDVSASVRLVEAAEGKDAADHLAAGHRIEELVHVPLPDDPDTRTNGANPASLSEKVVRQATRTTPGQPPHIALQKDILGKFATDLGRAGVAGEVKLATLEYLALTSRMLPWAKPTERPVSVVVKGTTSTGKSMATRTTLRFFPVSAFVDLGSMSRRYLFYTEDEFEHRFIYIPEWAGIKEDEELVAMVRNLLSEGKIVHGTVEGDGKRTPRRIEKRGPTGLLTSTTQAMVDAELETRCLSIVTDDSPEQTRLVFRALAALEDEVESPVDFDAWHQFQEWLAAHGETRVHVGFTQALAELMPAGATRLRRDFVTLLCLVRAHAILYRAQRQLDGHGRIVATVDGDYAPVRDLVADVIAEGADAGVSAAMRATVEGVQQLQGGLQANPVTPAKLAAHLQVGRSATYDRVRRALAAGYLVNTAKENERGLKLVVGTPLPGDTEFLPSPDAVVRQLSGTPPGQVFGLTMRPDGELSGSPGRPADPPTKSLLDDLIEGGVTEREARVITDAIHNQEGDQ